MNVPQMKNLSAGIKETRTRDHNWLKVVWFKMSWITDLLELHRGPMKTSQGNFSGFKSTKYAFDDHFQQHSTHHF
jgi:hypothetical protein